MVEVSTYYLDAVRVFIVLFLQKVLDSFALPCTWNLIIYQE